MFKWIDPRVRQSILEQKQSVTAGLLCSGGVAALAGLTTLLIKWTLAAIEDNKPEQLTWMAVAIVGIYGLRYFLTRGQMYYLSMTANRLSADLRQKLFAKLQRLPVSYFNDRRAGNIQSVLTNDVNVYQTAVTSMRDAIDGPIKILVGFLSIFIIQPQLTLISLAVMPLMAIFIQANAKRMKRAQADVQKDMSELTAMMQEQLQGTRIVKAFNAEELVISRFGGLVERAYSSQMVAAKRVSTLKPTVEFIGAVALAITVYCCGLLVSRDLLDVSDLGAFLMGLEVINQGVKSLGSLRQTLAQVQAASDRIYGEILDVEETLTDLPDAKMLPQPIGRIEFRDVTFAYPDGTKALDQVSFVIEPGTSLALVGPSGAGKSTIADLLLRFYDPSAGQVLFDGVDIRELKTGWYRSMFGVVPQQTFLFAGSIEDNLRLGAPDAHMDQIQDAVEKAHATGFVDSTPEKLGTVLGERGVRLSGGEGQRLAIARALVRNPLVLLLDEATSNLDAVSEKAVTEALAEVMHTRTTLFIAHRLTTAARADRILVLRRGKVVETGSHTELMQVGGTYAAMVNAFSKGADEDDVVA